MATQPLNNLVYPTLLAAQPTANSQQPTANSQQPTNLTENKIIEKPCTFIGAGLFVFNNL